jgi:hypothetical protein
MKRRKFALPQREELLEEIPDARPAPQTSRPGARSAPGWRLSTARVAAAGIAVVLITCGVALSAPFSGSTGSVSAFASTNRDAVYAPSPFSWSAPQLIDHQYPYTWPFGVNSMSCASTTLCVGTSEARGQIITSTDPTGTSPSSWSVLATSLISQDATGYDLAGVSCVTAGSSPFCLAAGRNFNTDVTEHGVVLSSADPTGGAHAWQPTALAEGLVSPPSCAQGGSTTLCVVAGGFSNVLYVSSNPGGAVPVWIQVTPNFTAGGPVGVACPSTSLCAAVSYSGQFVVSATPTNATSWSAASSTGLASTVSLSCPTTSFCLAAGYNAANAATIATTNDPSDGASAIWTTATPAGLKLGYYEEGISCLPDIALESPPAICFTGGSGNVEVSTDGGTSWSTEDLGTSSSEYVEANAISCPSNTLCLAGSTHGAVLNSQNASTGASASWSAPLPVAGGVSAVNISPQSCPSSSLCLASDGAGRVLTSTNPAGGVWSSSLVDPGGYGFGTPVCPSTTLCVATDNNGNLLTSTNPAGGGSSWSAPAPIDSGNQISRLDCPSTTLCVAVDGKGNVMTSTNPAGGSSSWSVPAGIDSTGIGRLVCPASTLCVAIDSNNRVLASTNPAGGASTWSVPASIGLGGITGLACPTAGLCVATGDEGHLVTSTNPAGGASTWSVPASIDSAWISQLQCPSSALCVAIDSNNRVLASTNPAGGASTWSAPSSLGAYIYQLACPTNGLCVATGSNGDVLTSIDPSGGAFAWSTPTSVDPAQYINGIACPTTTLCVLSDYGGNVIVDTGLPVPGSTSPPTISGSAVAGQTLSESNGSWTNSPTSSAYQWQRCDTAGGSCQPIAGATAQTYLLGAADVGSTIRVQETAGNAGGESSPATSEPTGVVQAPPSGGGGGAAATIALVTPTLSEPLPAPILGQSQTVGPVSGTVSVRLKGTSKFVHLSATSTIPNGSEVDATNGRVLITVATPTGQTQSAEVYGGRFIIQQDHSAAGETHLVLSLPLTGCPKVALPRGSAAVASRSKHHPGPKSRQLWVSEHGGSWGTNGRYVSTTVEGTRWLTLDECNRSEVKVEAGKVKVHDLVRNRTKALSAGQRYLVSRRG